MVAAVYGSGQVVEGFYLTPRFVGERIGLHPLAVIFALLAFGQLFGFVGVWWPCRPAPCCWWQFAACGAAISAASCTKAEDEADRPGHRTGPRPTLSSFCAGPNEAALAHLQLWAGNPTRSPVPTYLWGPAGSGKTHLLGRWPNRCASRAPLPGWLDAVDPRAAAVRRTLGRGALDDVHLYTAVQQHAAFTWFVSAPALQRGVLAAGAYRRPT